MCKIVCNFSGDCPTNPPPPGTFKAQITSLPAPDMIKNQDPLPLKTPIGLFLWLSIYMKYPLLNVSCEKGCVFRSALPSGMYLLDKCTPCVYVSISIKSPPPRGFISEKGLHITFNEVAQEFLKFFHSDKKNKTKEPVFIVKWGGYSIIKD